MPDADPALSQAAAFPLRVQLAEPRKLLGLDHLRAFAILYVILFHYQFFGHPAWVSKVAGFGWSGVDLFFVLSGFLISGQLFGTIAGGRTISLKVFFIKRFFRIIPPFLLIVGLYAFFPVLREWGHLSPIWRYLSFTLNFGLDLRKYGTFSHAWSLCVEEQFYFVLPLIFLLSGYLKTGTKVPWLLGALFIGGFMIRLWSWYHFMQPVLGTGAYGVLWNEYLYYPTYNRIDSLLVGVSVAGLFAFYPLAKEWVNQYSRLVLLSGLCLLVVSGLVCKGYSTFMTAIFGFPMIALAYGAIVAALVCPANPLYRLKSFLTAQIAALSYAMYLSHKIVIHVVQKLLAYSGLDKNGNLMMLCCFTATILAALSIRYSIEKPALRLRNYFLKRS